MEHAVILAGGSGKRLWPLSRLNRPKQLLRLFDNKSLLRKSFDRLLTVFDAEQLWVCAGTEHREAMLGELPELPADHFIGEPIGRDTANAIGLSAHVLAQRDPQAVMGVFTADHLISPVERFADAVRKAYTHVARNPSTLVCFGVSPTHPHTGLGYIHRGKVIHDGVFQVLSFKEKPDHQTARLYVDSGQYYWNCGMFVWHVETILSELREHLPANESAIAEMSRGWPTNGTIPPELVERYGQLKRISIDFAVMEKARSVNAVEMRCTWLDVGSWPALASVLSPDEAGNFNVGARVVSLDSEGNLVISETGHLVAMLGVQQMVIVHTPDATLVCPLHEAENLKTLVSQVEQKFPGRFE